MKNLLFILIMFFTITSHAQEYASDALFEKYAEQDGFTTIYISEYMFSLFAQLDDSGQDEFQKTIKGLKSIKILATDNNLGNSQLNFYQEILKSLPIKDYKELMVIKEKGQESKFLIKEAKQGVIGELLLISGGNDNTLISIKGNIDLKTISKLSKTMKIDGLEPLDQLENSKQN